MDIIRSIYEKFIVYEDSLKHELHQHDTFSRVLCGGVAGIVAKTAIAPAERVKMSYQVSNEVFSLKGALLRGISMVKTGGVLSLWRGHSTTVLRVAPYAGLSYAIHDLTEKELKIWLHVSQLPLSYQFLAGSVGGIGGTVLTYPLDVLRVRLALIPGSTWMDAIRRGGLFQGLTPTLLGIIPYSGTSWMVKQALHEHYKKWNSNRKPSVMESLAMNAVAGLIGQLFTYPLDIVRRRLQMFNTADKIVVSISNRPVPSFLEVLRTLFETEGFKGLTKGFSLNIIKGPITLSLSLTTYDILRHWIDSESDGHSHNGQKDHVARIVSE